MGHESGGEEDERGTLLRDWESTLSILPACSQTGLARLNRQHRPSGSHNLKGLGEEATRK